MKGKKLYKFLNSLSQAEKNQCTRFLLPGGKKTGKYAVLYKILTEQKVYDENLTLKALYKNGKQTSRRFEATCDYLGELIIQTLALKDEDLGSLLPVIRKAREKGLIRLAGKHLRKAIRKATQDEEYEDLLQLYQEKDLLTLHFGYLIDQKTDCLPRSEVFQALVRLEEMGRMLDEFRSVKWMASEGNATEQIGILQEKLERIQPQSTREKYLYYRLRMRLAFISRDYFLACEFQKKVMELVYQSGIPRIKAQRIEESGHMLRIYHTVGLFQEADLELMRLKAAPIRTRHEKNLFLKHSLVAAFISAFTLGKQSTGLCALEEFKEVGDEISIKDRVKLHYYAALFLAMNGDWKASRAHLITIQKLPARSRSIFSWQPELLLAIGYLEEEEPDMASTLLDRIERKAEKQTYPYLISKGLARILYAAPPEAKLLLANLRALIIDLRERPGSRLDAVYFDLILWIDARLEKTTPIEISKSQQYLSARQAFARVKVTNHQ